MYFCKICGRQLEKKGDICIDCYEGLIEEDEDQNNTEVIYTIKAQYKFGYEIMKAPFTFLLIAILIIFSIIVSFQNSVLTGILNLLVYLGAFVLYFLINKIRIESRTIELYKNKLIYTRKLHLKNRYEVRYRDIEEVQFEDLDKKSSILSQSSWWLFKVNKKYKMTDLFFKIRKTEESFFTTGFFIKPIYNFKEEVMPNLMKIMGFTERTEERRTNIEEMFNIKAKKKDKETDTNEDIEKDTIKDKEKDKENLNKKEKTNKKDEK